MIKNNYDIGKQLKKNREELLLDKMHVESILSYLYVDDIIDLNDIEKGSSDIKKEVLEVLLEIYGVDQDSIIKDSDDLMDLD